MKQNRHYLLMQVTWKILECKQKLELMFQNFSVQESEAGVELESEKCDSAHLWHFVCIFWITYYL